MFLANGIFIDEYFPATAELEVVTGQIIKAIHGNARLHAFFFKSLVYPPTVEDKLAYAKSFLKEIEQHRAWVDKNLWWIGS